jgi:hypothetical protein
LTLPNTSIDEDNLISGTWTMVYDEGFEIKMPNEIFFTFSKYKNLFNQVISI